MQFYSVLCQARLCPDWIVGMVTRARVLGPRYRVNIRVIWLTLPPTNLFRSIHVCVPFVSLTLPGGLTKNLS